MPESVLHNNYNHMALDSQQQEQTPSRALSVETNGRSDTGLADLPESSDPPSPRSSRDSSWLQVEVCRDFRRETCPRGAQCRFAHPDAKVMGRDGKVTCCYDFLKNRCNRDFCKYYHPPAHIKDRLVNAGRQFGAMMSNMTLVQPAPQVVAGTGPVMFAYGHSGDRLPICPDFLMGQCYLAVCPLVHPGPYVHQNVDQTVTVCRNFMRGWCVREETCRFYHPPPHHYAVMQQPAPILGLPNQVRA